MTTRHLNSVDHTLIHFDQALRTLFGQPQGTGRESPSNNVPVSELDNAARTRAGRLMRVNHAGEVCAQALYQGQALTARSVETRAQLEQSAREENDHLRWCQGRLEELGAHKSLLNPLWYAGSLALGAAAGLAGDRWSLGFVVETERQVEDHLDAHLTRLPPEDLRSRSILGQMKADEIHHAQVAKTAGGAPLPRPLALAMKAASKLMTHSAYWV